MIINFLLVLPLFFAQPQMLVDWDGTHADAVNILVHPNREVIDTCLRAGMEVRFRFEAQVCKRRSFWLPDCGDRLEVIHGMQYDPITETYQVRRDRLGDRKPEDVQTIASREEGLEIASRLGGLALQDLGYQTARVEGDRLFLSIKTSSDCRGEYSEVLSRIGYYLSLGLVKIDAFNSGWVAYELKGPGAPLTPGRE